MTTDQLLAELAVRGVFLVRNGERLIVDAPRGALTPDLQTALRAQKSEILSYLGTREVSMATARPHRRGLIDYAADVLPAIRFTVRETDNLARDFALLGRLRRVIEEHQPGGNHVYMRIVTQDRRRVTVEWRAIASRELRLGIARVLSAAARADSTSR